MVTAQQARYLPTFNRPVLVEGSRVSFMALLTCTTGWTPS